MFTEKCNSIFKQAIDEYHQFDDVNQPIKNPFQAQTIDHVLYRKSWIDTVQWHLEDIIREPEIEPVEALEIKRRIDTSNQDRTDTVEMIDSYFLEQYGKVEISEDATINTESPAWAIDRLSILALKIYHMKEEANRETASPEHKAECSSKLQVLLQQKEDLSGAINQLLNDIEAGKKYMKVYKQMKMYNDPNLNPVLYDKKK